MQRVRPDSKSEKTLRLCDSGPKSPTASGQVRSVRFWRLNLPLHLREECLRAQHAGGTHTYTRLPLHLSPFCEQTTWPLCPCGRFDDWRGVWINRDHIFYSGSECVHISKARRMMHEEDAWVEEQPPVDLWASLLFLNEDVSGRSDRIVSRRINWLFQLCAKCFMVVMKEITQSLITECIWKQLILPGWKYAESIKCSFTIIP